MPDFLTAELLIRLLAIALVGLVVPGTLYLLLLTLAGARRLPAPSATAAWTGRLAIVVPAHNEAGGIARTLANLLPLAAADGAAEVWVVADNCQDETAAIARAAGARVLERHNPEQRGKGYALDHAFTSLAGEGFAAYLVVDADTRADTRLLPALRARFAAGAEAVQARYGVLDAGASPRSQLARLALAAFNGLRPRGRQALGWSAGILGNGFALRREVLARVPYTATSVVEDLEYHLRLIEAGIRVHFADDTEVLGEMPTQAAGQKTQRARWEGGRLRMLIEHGPRLFGRLLRGEGRFAEPLLDLLLLPLAYHALLLLALLALPLPAARLLGGTGLLVLALHVLIAARGAGIGGSELMAIARLVPRYLLWKIAMLRSTVRASRQMTAWERTQRNHES